MSSLPSSSSSASRAGTHSLNFWSSSSSPATSIMSSHLRDCGDGFLSGPHRAGGPVLCSLPAKCRFITGSFIRDDLRIERETVTILLRHNMPYMEILPIGRLSKIYPEPEPIPTILVVMTPESVNRNDEWVVAAKEIHQKFVSEFPTISVEIIDDRLTHPPRYLPVESNHSVFSKWDAICENILRDRSLDMKHWNGISCWRHGYDPDPMKNRVTIIISVGVAAVGDSFVTATRRIQGILAEAEEHDVDILFQESSCEPYVMSPLLPYSVSSETNPVPGTSIGICNSSAGSSTLGGFIELEFPGDPKPRQYALTCFHSVFAPEGRRDNLLTVKGAQEAFKRWEYEPVRPNDPTAQDVAPFILRVEHPSTDDITRTMAKLDHKISDIKDEEFEAWKVAAENGTITEDGSRQYEADLRQIARFTEKKDNFQALRDNNELGPVFAGSGLHRSEYSSLRKGTSLKERRCIMDWALIEVRKDRIESEEDGRLKGNKPFDYDHPDIVHVLGFTNTSPIQFDKFLNGSAKVYKSGRSTKVTKGVVNGLREVQLSHEELPSTALGYREIATYEHAVVTSDEGQPFCEKGDSGSFVYGSRGQVVGLLFAGRLRGDIGYMTDIRDLYTDIKGITGAKSVRIPPWSHKNVS